MDTQTFRSMNSVVKVYKLGEKLLIMYSEFRAFAVDLDLDNLPDNILYVHEDTDEHDMSNEVRNVMENGAVIYSV